jgi:hypothetical protein
MDAQAGEILAKLARGVPVAEIARDMSMCRDTVYARVKLISRQLPSRDVLRMVQYERNEYLFQRLINRIIDDEVSTADFVRGIAEGRQLGARQATLLKLDDAEVPPDADRDDPRVDVWVAEAASENEAEIREVRGG